MIKIFFSALYSEQWTEQLQFVEKPKLGTICVAKFIIDHCWYRAKIIKELPNSNYEVCGVGSELDQPVLCNGNLPIGCGNCTH